MRINNKLSVVSLVLILFIIACTSSSNQKTSKEVDVRVGFDGLKMEFLKNTPPEKVFESDTIPVVIKIRNNGAYSLDDNSKAVLYLGVEKDYTKKVDLLANGKVQPVGTGNAATFSLEGKSSINPSGEEQVISYNIKAGNVDPQSEFHSSTLISTLCYPYQTILDTTVCIDTDVAKLRPGKKVCSVQDMIFNNGQGAPVAVTKIESSMLPSQIDGQGQESGKTKPQFLIFVENKGQGIVIKNDAIGKYCTQSSTSHSDLNIVYVEAYLSGKRLKCQLDTKPDSNELGHIKLKDKKDIIRCFLEDPISSSQDPYLSPLKITLMYGYTQSISANYFIQKAAR